MTKTVLKRQYITDANGTPIGIILPIEEYALIQDLLEWMSPSVKETNPKALTDLVDRSIQDAEFFGMWADRKDLIGRSSREWLDGLRSDQWSRL